MYQITKGKSEREREIEREKKVVVVRSLYKNINDIQELNRPEEVVNDA